MHPVGRVTTRPRWLSSARSIPVWWTGSLRLDAGLRTEVDTVSVDSGDRENERETVRVS